MLFMAFGFMAPRGSHFCSPNWRALESAREPADGGGGNGGGGGAAADDGADGDGGGDVGGGGGVDEVAGEPLVGRPAAVAAVKVKNGETAEAGRSRSRRRRRCARGGSPGLWGGDSRRLRLATGLEDLLDGLLAAGEAGTTSRFSTRFEEAAARARATRQGSAAIVLWMGGGAGQLRRRGVRGAGRCRGRGARSILLHRETLAHGACVLVAGHRGAWTWPCGGRRGGGRPRSWRMYRA